MADNSSVRVCGGCSREMIPGVVRYYYHKSSDDYRCFDCTFGFPWEPKK